MTIPLHALHDRIKQAGSMTDSEMRKSISKDGHSISDDKLNKMLLDLEIMGLITVSWVTKDERRIEVNVTEEDAGESDGRGKQVPESNYEASFPGA